MLHSRPTVSSNTNGVLVSALEQASGCRGHLLAKHYGEEDCHHCDKKLECCNHTGESIIMGNCMQPLHT